MTSMTREDFYIEEAIMKNLFKRAERTHATVPELAMTAVDMVDEEVAELRLDAADARACLRNAATWLGEINDELAQKSALCGSLMAQLQATQETITKQTEANATMREQVMSLLGLV